MRAGEIISLTWAQVDFAAAGYHRRASEERGGAGRQIPMNRDLSAVLSIHSGWFTKRFGELRQSTTCSRSASPHPTIPGRPITDVTGAWKALRKAAGVQCRLHDLRHTAATKMAEAGVPESTMLALMGHMSRAMLERYSHIRMAAKREAVEVVELATAEAKAERIQR